MLVLYNSTVSAVNSSLSTPQAQQLTELYNKNVPRSQADIKAELEQLYAANVGTPQRQNVYNGTVQNGASGGMISNGQQIASPSVGQTATPQQSSKPQTPLNENGNRTDNTKPELDNAQTDQYNNGEEKNGTIPERIEDATERAGDVENRPYLNPKNRPSFRKGIVESTWEKSRDADGIVRDPNTGEIIKWALGLSRKGIWDMGHIPGQKYHDIYKKYVEGEITPEQFRDWYNDSDNYRPEIPGNNRGHMFE